MLDFVAKESSFSNTAESFGKFAIEVTLDTSVDNFFEVVVEFLKGVRA